MRWTVTLPAPPATSAGTENEILADWPHTGLLLRLDNQAPLAVKVSTRVLRQEVGLTDFCSPSMATDRLYQVTVPLVQV